MPERAKWHMPNATVALAERNPDRSDTRMDSSSPRRGQGPIVPSQTGRYAQAFAPGISYDVRR
jgi:hypothetical protein